MMKITNQISLSGSNLVEQYRAAGLSYPKFFKMDNLSKLGYLACSKLLENKRFERGDEVALVMCCRSSSLDTDIEFEGTIIDGENFFPSPSIFVYTLPNIVLGEIAIAFNITGENCCYICDSIEQADFETKVRHLFDYTPTQKVICGWIEYSPTQQRAEIMMVEK